MAFNKRVKIKTILEQDLIGQEITLMGWVRTKRSNKNVSFIALNDGSIITNYQVVADPNVIAEEVLKKCSTGACLKITGTVIASQGAGQQSELNATRIEVLGESDPEKYPLQPKKHSLEFLREIAHLRMRTNTFGAVFRVRHALAYAVHTYFNTKGFFYIHTPIITASDAEGAGETFKVTTLNLSNPPKTEDGKIDYSQDFFERETNLTVSGQLEGELAAMALAEIYTFGPTFRAENSNTTRHLAEFWMIEPEMAFYDAEDNQNLAEDFLKYICSYILNNCSEDVKFLSERDAQEQAQKPQNERNEMTLLERLKFVIENPLTEIGINGCYGMFDLLDLVLKSPLKSLKTNQQIFIEHTGLNKPNSYFVKVIDKKTNTPSSCIKINNSTVSQVDCNPLENKQIWEIDFLGQSKEICLIKSTDTEKYLLSMANSGPNTNGSQFFLVYQDTQFDPNYTIWGKITAGLNIVKAIGAAGVKGGGSVGTPGTKIAIESVIVN